MPAPSASKDRRETCCVMRFLHRFFKKMFVCARTDPSAARSNAHRYAAPAFESWQAELARGIRMTERRRPPVAAPSGSVKVPIQFFKQPRQFVVEPSFRDGPQDQTRNLEIPGSMRSLSSGRASRGPVGIATESGVRRSQ